MQNNLPDVQQRIGSNKAKLTKQLFYPRESTGSWPWPEQRPSTSPIKRTYDKSSQQHLFSDDLETSKQANLLNYNFLNQSHTEGVNSDGLNQQYIRSPIKTSKYRKSTTQKEEKKRSPSHGRVNS